MQECRQGPRFNIQHPTKKFPQTHVARSSPLSPKAICCGQRPMNLTYGYAGEARGAMDGCECVARGCDPLRWLGCFGDTFSHLPLQSTMCGPLLFDLWSVCM